MRLVLGLALVLFASACAHAPEALVWAPLTPPGLSASTPERAAFFAERIRVEVLDKRDEGKVVFRDRETSILTPDDIATFYSGHFVQTLASYGVQVVDRDETLVVRLSIRRALGSRGAGEWGLKNHCGDFLVLLESRRPQDSAFASVGEVQGSSLRIGSGDAGNYHEAMTSAVLDTARQLLQDRDLLRMLVSPEPVLATPASAPDSPVRKPVTR
ncbi:MAG: hypothetical protein QM765_36390 [Myxococcales bacterium]